MDLPNRELQRSTSRVELDLPNTEPRGIGTEDYYPPVPYFSPLPEQLRSPLDELVYRLDARLGLAHLQLGLCLCLSTCLGHSCAA
jgi:hypothetical protein